MILPLVAALALAPQEVMGGQIQTFSRVDLPNPYGGPSRLMYLVYEDRLTAPKLSPKKFGEPPAPWSFEWVVPAYGKAVAGREDILARFRVYSQERKEDGDLAPQVAQMLLRLWEINKFRFRLEHQGAYNSGIIDVYLCWGGQAGGEQMFDEDIINGRAIKVNTIYIYDLQSFTDPVERAREIAHEYGHATLPPIGGFETPEDWANGYLGEKLFLRLLGEELRAGRLKPADVMGVTPAALDAWLAKNVDPLLIAAASAPPETASLVGKGPTVMNRVIGLQLYLQALVPERVFVRSMLLNGSGSAKDLLSSIDLAIEEAEPFRLKVPALLRGRTVWFPLGKGNLSGAAITGRKGNWVRFTLGANPITVVPKRPS